MINRVGYYVSKHDDFKSHFTIKLPVSEFMEKQAKNNGYTITPKLIKCYIELDKFLILPRWSIIKFPSSNVIFQPNKKDNNLPLHECNLELKGNQELIINHIMDKYENRQKLNLATFILQLKTGAGKTYVASSIVSKFNKKTLWILPMISLLEQTYDAIKIIFPTLKIGFWYGQCHDSPEECDIILAIADSLINMTKIGRAVIPYTNAEGKRVEKEVTLTDWMDNFGTTIYDEVHLYCGETECRIFWFFSALNVLAMSATIDDNKNNLDQIYKWHFGDPIYADQIQGYSHDDLKWKCKVHTIKYHGSHENTKITSPSFISALRMIEKDNMRNEIIINFINELLGRGHNIFVFCEFRDHAAKLLEMFMLNHKKEYEIAHDEQENEVEEEEEDEQPQTKRGRPRKTNKQNTNVNQKKIDVEYILYRGGVNAETIDAARNKASVIFTTYSYTSTGVSIVRMSAIVFATPRKTGMKQITGRIERRGGDLSLTREIYDIVDEKIFLKKQFEHRKDVYVEKNYELADFKIIDGTKK